jgi:hypothetical protein
MEILTQTQEAVQVEANAAADLQSLIELSAHDLALVGGGMVNVSFY